MKKRISQQEIEELYQIYKTPPHVIGHCKAVAKVAVKLGQALNAHGYHMDIALINGAGLAHDIARLDPEHWNIMADKLEELGYTDESHIVRVHMHYSFHSLEALDETDMVCLGDRLVKEDAYVGLDERIHYIIEKTIAAGMEDRVDAILKSKKETETLLLQIEEIIEERVDCLCDELKGKA